MTMRGIVRPVLAAAGLLCGMAAMAAPAEGPAFVAFSSVERGQWALREVGGTARSMCVADPAVLFQLRGARGGNCSRFVIENGSTSATVHYTCPGMGHGRTTITVETPRLMRIESSGVEAGAPFAIEVEARRTGACS